MDIRKITFVRDNQIRGALAEFHILIDKKDCGNLEFRKSKEVELDYNSHVMEVQGIFSNGICRSMEYDIPAGMSGETYMISFRPGTFGGEFLVSRIV